MTWAYLIGSLLLIVACGIFVATEFAFITVDRASVDGDAAAGDRTAQGLQTALGSLSTQLSGAQVGITVTNLAIGLLAEPTVVHLVESPLHTVGLAEGTVTAVATTLGMLLATVITMVFGELVPKNLAIANPMRAARTTQRFQRGFTASAKPLIRLLNGSANLLLGAVGIEPQEELRSARTSEELRSLVAHSVSEGTLDAPTAQLMQRSMAFANRTAGEIMTPRVRMDAVRATDKIIDLLELARSTGHSRFPVIEGSDATVVGSVHIKHGLAVPVASRRRKPVRDIMVEALEVPQSLRLDPLLTRLREEGFQVAVVVDEYGGTAGFVTLEDVVEEIVGDITDEHDPLSASVRRWRDGSWLLSGLLRPDEVAAATGVRLPARDDYDTIAGLIIKRTGKMGAIGDETTVLLPLTLDPETGEPEPQRVAVLTVEHVAGLRIDRIRMRTCTAEQLRTHRAATTSPSSA